LPGQIVAAINVISAADHRCRAAPTRFHLPAHGAVVGTRSDLRAEPQQRSCSLEAVDYGLIDEIAAAR
jgi:hypothetical protein